MASSAISDLLQRCGLSLESASLEEILGVLIQDSRRLEVAEKSLANVIYKAGNIVDNPGVVRDERLPCFEPAEIPQTNQIMDSLFPFLNE